MIQRLVHIVLVVGIISCALAACSHATDSDGAQQISSAVEGAKIVQACMRDRGWNVTVQDDGGVAAEVPNAQAEQYSKAQRECWVRVKVRSFEQLSSDEVKTIFDRQSMTLACLVALDVTSATAPTFQKFVEDHAHWSAYSEVPADILRDRIDELETACPQVAYY